MYIGVLSLNDCLCPAAHSTGPHISCIYLWLKLN